jgi:hypothetical protein
MLPLMADERHPRRPTVRAHSATRVGVFVVRIVSDTPDRFVAVVRYSANVQRRETARPVAARQQLRDLLLEWLDEVLTPDD